MCPHFFFLQLVARGGRRAYKLSAFPDHIVSRLVAYVALSADHLVAVELGGKGLERGLDDATTKTENEMKSRFLEGPLSAHHILQTSLPFASEHSQAPQMLAHEFSPYLLDIIVRKSASILQLLSGEDQSLLVRGNALLILNL